MTNQEYMQRINALTTEAMKYYDLAAAAKHNAKQAQTEGQRQAYLNEAQCQIARYHGLQAQAWQIMKPQSGG